MKPFSTHRQQIKILRSRGLKVDGSRAMRILERENYYNVINGYKDLFLRKDPSGNPISPETYKLNCNFDEIYELFSFDRELRNILLKYLLMFENSIKSKISYRFSEQYKEAHAYLQFQNYSRDPNKLQKILKLIAILSSEISKKTKRDNPIKHYLDNHGGVPLWVLVNYLTLGNMNNFYDCLDSNLRDTIAKDFSKQFKSDYGVQHQITTDTISDVLKTANFFRNVCAHEERLYNFKLHSTPRGRHNSTLLNIPQQHLIGSLFTAVAFLKLVLPKNDHIELIKSLNELLTEYDSKFVTVNFSDITDEMGFPRNWNTYF